MVSDSICPLDFPTLACRVRTRSSLRDLSRFLHFPSAEALGYRRSPLPGLEFLPVQFNRSHMRLSFITASESAGLFAVARGAA